MDPANPRAPDCPQPVTASEDAVGSSETVRNSIAEDLFLRVAAYVPGIKVKGAVRPTAEKPWQKWLDAELGLRNHWYPVAASRHIPEGTHKVI
jgi:hypothetical protein